MSLIYNNLFGDFFDDNYLINRKPKTNFNRNVDTKCNVYKKDDSFVFDLFLPGFSKQDFEIDVENSILTVSGQNSYFDKKDYVHQEHTQLLRFKRSFALPKDANIEQIDATYDAGILSLTVPTFEEKKTSAKRITVS